MAAHSLRECRGAMARRGGRLPYLGYPVTPMLAHMLAWGGRRGRLFRPPRSGGGSVPVAAHSLRECRGAMARRGGPLPYLVYPVLARMLACKVDYTEIRLSRNDDGAVPVAAHSLRECRGAIVRRRMLFAYLGCPVTRMHVCGGGRDPIFGFRETVIGRRNSHLETLRRTQEVLNCPQNTVLQAYT